MSADQKAGANPAVDRSNPPGIRFDSISRSFGATKAVQNASFFVAAATVHCLLGENGAGKSTIGKILAGVHAQDEGRIFIDGQPVQIRSIREARALGIATVFQELSLARDLSVVENICLGREARFLTPSRRRQERRRTGALLAKLGLALDLDRRVGDLPTAQQQLVELAKALMGEPRILILDEPTAMLGMADRKRLLDIVRALREGGTTILFVSHHLDEVLSIGDTVSIMRDGIMVESFPLHEGIDADHIVEKVSGRLATLETAPPLPATGPDILALRGLPGQSAETEISLKRGEIIGIYGVAGCGREQLAEMIVGLISAAAPMTMQLDGAAYRPSGPAQARRAGIGYLPTGRALNGILPGRSVRENLMITQLDDHARGPFIRRAKERSSAEAQLAALRTRMGSPEHPITSLSGGNQQKVLIGRFLTDRTRIVVLEDPTAGIDIAAKLEIHDHIRRRVSEGLSVILISSDLHETISLCSTVFTMFQGKIVGRFSQPTHSDEAAILADVLGIMPGATAQSAH